MGRQPGCEVTRLAPLVAAVALAAVALLSGAVLTLADRADRETHRADVAEARRSVCSCRLLGGADDAVMGFDTFTVGEAKATPGEMDSMLIPARTVCGPMRLRAWLGAESP
jgi:hypothetical protein